MYRFDTNRPYNQPIVAPILSSVDYKLNLYIPVCHTNRRPIKNMIGVVMNRLVGMALKSLFSLTPSNTLWVNCHIIYDCWWYVRMRKFVQIFSPMNVIAHFNIRVTVTYFLVKYS